MTNDPTHLASEPPQLRSAARCGAKTRSGKPCQAPVVAGRTRCRMHGGAKGSGGPRGMRNGNYKHGRHTAESRARAKWLRDTTREIQAITDKLRKLTRA
jgi:hypothetical protein